MSALLILPEPYHSRFWARVDTNHPSGCWHWNGGRQAPTKSNQNPYGVFAMLQDGVRRRQVHVHRLSYEMHIGPIPAGMCVCHSCDVPYCVNPDHLWLGTHGDNMADLWDKLRSGRRRYSDITKVGVLGIPHLSRHGRSGGVLFQVTIRGVRHNKCLRSLEVAKRYAREFFASHAPDTDLTPYQ